MNGTKTLLGVATRDDTGERLAVYREANALHACPIAQWEAALDAAARSPAPPACARTQDAYPPTTDAAHATNSAMAADMIEARRTLKRVFGYEAFRDGQERVIGQLLSSRDVLAVMPTGAGKSMCYQLPALVLDGVTIVVSPLISLMKDQVSALSQSGVRAAYLNSSLTERQFQTALGRAESGQYQIIYVAPERLLTPRFGEMARRLHIALIAVDEAHCLSQWGQDFRPSYLSIPDFIEQLPFRPPVCALTATATPRVREDVARLLRLNDPYTLVTGFDRPNLSYQVIQSGDKRGLVRSLVRERTGQSGIVYCATRKQVEQVCDLLSADGVPATRYHAGLSDEERRDNQDDFTFDRRPVMVATNAFGMGIDKSDVRFVIHYNMPKDMESYYQEAGRAGRDGENAACILLFSRQDMMTQRLFIDHIGEESDLPPEQARQLKNAATDRLNQMMGYCQTTQCLRQYILRYFGENAPDDCGNCDNCLNPKQTTDQSGTARAILDCVRQTGQRFGASLIVKVLRGGKDERITRLGLSRLPMYGSMADTPQAELNNAMDQLLEQGYLNHDGGLYSIVRLGEQAQSALSGAPVFLRAPSAPTRTGSGRRTDSKSSARAAATGRTDPTRFQQLRALRAQIASEKGVPAFIIFSDATLSAMCDIAPQNEMEMLGVPGVGQAKWSAYGDRFLSITRRWRDDQ